MSTSPSSDNEDNASSFIDEASAAAVATAAAASTTDSQDLQQLSVEQLNQYQDKISREFKLLSKDYLNKRLSRINVMLDKLTSLIKLATANDKSWLKIYNFEIETINNIMTNTEDLIMVGNKTISNKPDLLKLMDEYEVELQEIFTNLQSPFDFDDTFKFDNGEIDKELNNSHPHLSKLPFPFLFNQSFKPHRDELKSISLEKDYQLKLIRNNCRNNSTIVWNQYYMKLNQYKNKLLDNAQRDLNQLYKDYHQLNESRNEELLDRYYYRSLISPQYLLELIDNSINMTNTDDLEAIVKTNHDSNYVELDTRLNPKNKIELSMIRQQDKCNDNLVGATHAAIKRRYSKAFKLRNGDTAAVAFAYGTNQSRVDDDLQLIRRKIRCQNEMKQHGSMRDEDDNVYSRTLHDYSDEEDAREEQGDKAEENGTEKQNDGDYEEIMEEYDVEEDMTPAQLEERKIYKHVLNNRPNSTSSKFRMLELPPLENFPRL